MAEAAGLAESLAARWTSLSHAAGLGEARHVGSDLLAAYQEPHRRYHGLTHIRFLLDEIDRRALMFSDACAPAFAAWFHDAIYDPLAKDNEERSAAWAARDLEGLGYPQQKCTAVADLILKTKSHHAGEADADEALFLDMDFAILGAARSIYSAYAEGVRAEYAAVPELAFRAGRAAFLASVLAQPRMFRTDLYERDFGAQARDNIAWEIKRLHLGALL